MNIEHIHKSTREAEQSELFKRRCKLTIRKNDKRKLCTHRPYVVLCLPSLSRMNDSQSLITQAVIEEEQKTGMDMSNLYLIVCGLIQ